MSGRFVAPITTSPPSPRTRPSRPGSGSASAHAHHCPARYPAPRLRPAASNSSMKMIAGAALRALRNRSRTRAAPTPPTTPRNPSPRAEERRVGFPRDRLRQQRLARPRRPHQQHTLRRRRPDRQILARVRQIITDLPQLRDRLTRPRDIRESDPFTRALALLRPFPVNAENAAIPPAAPSAPDPHEQREQTHQQQDRDQKLHDDRRAWTSPTADQPPPSHHRHTSSLLNCCVCAPDAGYDAHNLCTPDALAAPPARPGSLSGRRGTPVTRSRCCPRARSGVPAGAPARFT